MNTAFFSPDVFSSMPSIKPVILSYDSFSNASKRDGREMGSCEKIALTRDSASGSFWPYDVCAVSWKSYVECVAHVENMPLFGGCVFQSNIDVPRAFVVLN